MENYQNDSHTSTDACEIDYEKIEDCFYNALNKYYSEKNINADISQSDVVDFHTSTDSRLYTVDVVSPPTSSAEQTTAILFDIRNIIFIFLSFYLILTIYSRLKNAVIHLYKKGD